MVAAVAAVVAGVGAINRFDPRVLVLAAGLAGLIAVLACVPPVRRAVRSEPPRDAVPRSVALAGDSVGG
jgi:hypothetical protein